MAQSTPYARQRACIDLQKGKWPHDAMMARWIELWRFAVGKGEYPFATIIASGVKIVAEPVDRTIRERHIIRQAEILALFSDFLRAFAEHVVVLPRRRFVSRSARKLWRTGQTWPSGTATRPSPYTPGV